MSRQTDQMAAVQVGWALDLAAMVAAVRAEDVEHLPKDPVFALALVVVSLAMDHETVTSFLMPPSQTIEAGGRSLHAEARVELTRQYLRDVVTRAKRDPKGK